MDADEVHFAIDLRLHCLLPLVVAVALIGTAFASLAARL